MAYQSEARERMRPVTLGAIQSRADLIFFVVLFVFISLGSAIRLYGGAIFVAFVLVACIYVIIKKALFYPAAIMIMAFIVTAILMIFVIPQFSTLFADFGADLPAMTQMVVNMSDFFVANWYFIFGGLGLGGWMLAQLHRRSQAFRFFIQRMSLKAPVYGDILVKATIARFARTLGTMFAAGVPLVEAMDSVAGAAGNIVYATAIYKMRDEIATGTQLQVSMRDTNLFPNMVVQMVAIGEESGSIDHMLAKVADFYEEEVDNAVDAMSSLMEPLIMAVLGVLIGGMVIAMYLPIFKMGQVV